MIDEKELVKKLDEAKKMHKEACERGNGLVAEYYEGVIDTLSDIIIVDSLTREDEWIIAVNNVYVEIVKNISGKQFDPNVKLFVLDAISESCDKIRKSFEK